MKLAYADPPYLGCAALYRDHPDAQRWDDIGEHKRLLASLDRDYSGWVYSMSSVSLSAIIPVAPDGVRIGAWVKSFAAFKRNVRVAYTWEPVLFRQARISSSTGALVGRDHLSEPIAMRRGLTGAKPHEFCRWILMLMGYVPGQDVVYDLFPGTGSLAYVLPDSDYSTAV